MKAILNLKLWIFGIACLCAGCCAGGKCDEESLPEGGLKKSEIVGKWDVTHMFYDENNKWQSIAILGKDFAYAIFRKNDSYEGKIGNDIDHGTYFISDSCTITCLVPDGKTTYYKVTNLDGDKATIEMTKENDAKLLKFRVERKK